MNDLKHPQLEDMIRVALVKVSIVRFKYYMLMKDFDKAKVGGISRRNEKIVDKLVYHNFSVFLIFFLF